jgi:hypothetical protein
VCLVNLGSTRCISGGVVALSRTFQTFYGIQEDLAQVLQVLFAACSKRLAGFEQRRDAHMSAHACFELRFGVGVEGRRGLEIAQRKFRNSTTLWVSVVLYYQLEVFIKESWHVTYSSHCGKTFFFCSLFIKAFSPSV